MSKKFISHSPKNVMFLGAGATANLIPMTKDISRFITVLSDEKKTIDEKINDAVFKNFKEGHKKAFNLYC